MKQKTSLVILAVLVLLCLAPNHTPTPAPTGTPIPTTLATLETVEPESSPTLVDVTPGTSSTPDDTSITLQAPTVTPIPSLAPPPRRSVPADDETAGTLLPVTGTANAGLWAMLGAVMQSLGISLIVGAVVYIVLRLLGILK